MAASCAAAGRRVLAEHDVMRGRETLGRLGVAPERVGAAGPLPGGLSGGELARLTLAAHTAGESRWYASRVLKRVRPRAGWLGEASADTLAREARLWSSGVLADLPTSLATGVLASAQDAGGGFGALLMRALRGGRRGAALDVGTRRRVGAKPRLSAGDARRAARWVARAAAGLGAGDGGPGDLRSPLALRHLARTGPGARAGGVSRAADTASGGARQRARSRHLACVGGRRLPAHGAHLRRSAGPHRRGGCPRSGTATGRGTLTLVGAPGGAGGASAQRMTRPRVRLGASPCALLRRYNWAGSRSPASGQLSAERRRAHDHPQPHNGVQHRPFPG